jgi:activating signal cointegrator 1
MKAISLWQPWASAMTAARKRNETRSWAASYRGDMAICAAKRKPTPEELLAIERWIGGLELVYGVVLCVVRLHRVVPTEFERNAIRPMEIALGDYRNGRFAWQTDCLRPLRTPVPVIGRQGLFNITGETERRILEQM